MIRQFLDGDLVTWEGPHIVFRTPPGLWGDTVNVASRLKEATAEGGVYISQDTYRLVRHLFRVEPLGEVSLDDWSGILLGGGAFTSLRESLGLPDVGTESRAHYGSKVHNVVYKGMAIPIAVYAVLVAGQLSDALKEVPNVSEVTLIGGRSRRATMHRTGCRR